MNPHRPPLPSQGRGDLTVTGLIQPNAIENQPFLSHFAAQKIRDCIRIAALLRERVLRLPFGCKKPRDAEFT